MDNRFDTGPWFTTAGLLAGTATAFFGVYRMIKPGMNNNKPNKGKGVPKKRKLLGCSFPVIIIIAVVALGLLCLGFLSGPIGKSMVPGVYDSLPGFLKLHEPVVELPAEVIFNLFGLPITNSILATWFTIIVLGLLVLFISRKIRPVPRRWQMLLEFGLGWLLGFCQRVAGEKNGRRFFPVVTTIFLFVMFNAWLSLLPGFGQSPS